MRKSDWFGILFVLFVDFKLRDRSASQVGGYFDYRVENRKQALSNLIASTRHCGDQKMKRRTKS